MTRRSIMHANPVRSLEVICPHPRTASNSSSEQLAVRLIGRREYDRGFNHVPTQGANILRHNVKQLLRLPQVLCLQHASIMHESCKSDVERPVKCTLCDFSTLLAMHSCSRTNINRIPEPNNSCAGSGQVCGLCAMAMIDGVADNDGVYQPIHCRTFESHVSRSWRVNCLYRT
jgi:hypothetical protein